MWHEGTIGAPIGSKDNRVAQLYVKSFDEGSEFGIDGGKISKLQILINGSTVVNYDRGWDIEPDKNDELIMMAYNILIHEYN